MCGDMEEGAVCRRTSPLPLVPHPLRFFVSTRRCLSAARRSAACATAAPKINRQNIVLHSQF